MPGRSSIKDTIKLLLRIEAKMLKTMMFETTFKATLAQFTTDLQLVEKLWTELSAQYNKRNRHYHNLQHLDYLVHELLTVKDKIDDWQVIVFSIAYHDIIYNVLKQDNEEKSAAIAYERTGLLNIAVDRKDKCKAQILATKTHRKTDDNDTDYFTDADLAILGSSYFHYKKYTEQIRKEYKYYPDVVYKPGR